MEAWEDFVLEEDTTFADLLLEVWCSHNSDTFSQQNLLKALLLTSRDDYSKLYNYSHFLTVKFDANGENQLQAILTFTVELKKTKQHEITILPVAVNVSSRFLDPSSMKVLQMMVEQRLLRFHAERNEDRYYSASEEDKNSTFPIDMTNKQADGDNGSMIHRSLEKERTTYFLVSTAEVVRTHLIKLLKQKMNNSSSSNFIEEELLMLPFIPKTFTSPLSQLYKHGNLETISLAKIRKRVALKIAADFGYSALQENFFFEVTPIPIHNLTSFRDYLIFCSSLPETFVSVVGYYVQNDGDFQYTFDRSRQDNSISLQLHPIAVLDRSTLLGNFICCLICPLNKDVVEYATLNVTSSDQILPLFSVSIRPSYHKDESKIKLKFNDEVDKKLLESKNAYLLARKKIPKLGAWFTLFPDRPSNNNPSDPKSKKADRSRSSPLISNNQKWILTLSPTILCTSFRFNSPELSSHFTQVIYILDKSTSMAEKYKAYQLPSCDLIHNGTNSNASDAIFFGSSVDHFKVTRPDFFLSPEIQNICLENGRNFNAAYNKAIDLAYQTFVDWKSQQEKLILLRFENEALHPSKRKKEIQRLADNLQLQFSVLFVYFSNGKGNYTLHEQSTLLDSFESASKILKMRSFFKVIELGKSVNTAISLKAKYATETQQYEDNTPIYFTKDLTRLLPIVIPKLISDIKAINEGGSICVEIPSYYSELGKGFISNFTSHPLQSIHVRLKSQSSQNIRDQIDVIHRNKELESVVDDAQVSIMHEGIPPSYIMINGRYLPVFISAKTTAHHSVLELLQRFANDIKLYILSRRFTSIDDVERNVSLLREMIQRIKFHEFPPSLLSFLTAQTRAVVVRSMKKLVNDLEAIFNKVVDSFLLLKSDQKTKLAASWVKSASSMKFGARVLRRIQRLKPPPSSIVSSSSSLLENTENQNGLMIGANKKNNTKNKKKAMKSVGKTVKKIRQGSVQSDAQIDAVLDQMSKSGEEMKNDNRNEAKKNAKNQQKLIENFHSKVMSQFTDTEGRVTIPHRESDFVSSFSTHNAIEHLQEFVSSNITIDNWYASKDQKMIERMVENDDCAMITDLLYSYGMVGICIQVFRSETSNIDPYTLIVDYVSTNHCDTASALCALDGGIDLVDPSTQHPTEDVLILLDPRNPTPYEIWIKYVPLHKYYLSIVFTRNPMLHLPSQYPALLMITLIKSIEQLMLSKQHHQTPRFLRTIFHLIYTLRRCIFSNPMRLEYWRSMLQKLSLSSPWKYMTEAEDDEISSVIKLLAPILCLSDAKFLFEPQNLPTLSEVALSLIGESVSRNARVLLRSKMQLYVSELPSISHSLIQKALSINLDAEKQFFFDDFINKPSSSSSLSSINDRTSYDPMTLRRYSSKFFRRTFQGTNCNPYAVVAAIEFAAILHSHLNSDFSSLDHMLEHDITSENDVFFSNILRCFQDVSMKSFIQKYAPQCSPLDVQNALYLQGIKFYNSSLRKQNPLLTSLTNPLKLITDITLDERRYLYDLNLRDHMKNLRSGKKDELRRIKIDVLTSTQNDFIRVHDFPTLFSYDEVDRLNLHRPPDDQLELIPGSSLLKHHCCAPLCPFYLHNFATLADRQFGSRHGLFAHLKFFFIPQKIYFKQLHLICCPLAKRIVEKEKFLNSALSLLGGEPSSEALRSRLLYLLSHLFDQIHSQSRSPL